MNKGKIVQVMGAIVDVKFEKLPNINNALVIKKGEQLKNDLVLEVAVHVGDSVVRCISMDSTDGLKRGMEVIDTESPITVPVGKVTLGRVFNV